MDQAMALSQLSLYFSLGPQVSWRMSCTSWMTLVGGDHCYQPHFTTPVLPRPDVACIHFTRGVLCGCAQPCSPTFLCRPIKCRVGGVT